jgi:hypothetical protein
MAAKPMSSIRSSASSSIKASMIFSRLVLAGPLDSRAGLRAMVGLPGSRST